MEQKEIIVVIKLYAHFVNGGITKIHKNRIYDINHKETNINPENKIF